MMVASNFRDRMLKKSVLDKSIFDFHHVLDAKAVEDIVYLAGRAHAESRFSYITFAPNKVRSIFEIAISNPKKHAIFLASKNQNPIGFAYCSVGEYHIGVGSLVTTIHNINVIKEVRHSFRGGRVAIGLFRGVESWSRARSSQEILFHVTSGVDLERTHKFIKKIGYKFVGGSYAKRVS